VACDLSSIGRLGGIRPGTPRGGTGGRAAFQRGVGGTRHPARREERRGGLGADHAPRGTHSLVAGDALRAFRARGLPTPGRLTIRRDAETWRPARPGRERRVKTGRRLGGMVNSRRPDSRSPGRSALPAYLLHVLHRDAPRPRERLGNPESYRVPGRVDRCGRAGPARAGRLIKTRLRSAGLLRWRRNMSLRPVAVHVARRHEPPVPRRLARPQGHRPRATGPRGAAH